MAGGDRVRHLVLDAAFSHKAGHVGSCLSVADILIAVYSYMGPNDRFVLSKGHAAFALYAALYLSGRITAAQYADALEHEHPDVSISGVEFSTGSLGQGITYAVGLALAKELDQRAGLVYCLVSDAETQEGSFWEALRFAVQSRLQNLIIIVDNNHMQALGQMPYQAIVEKVRAFGSACTVVDGHKISDLHGALGCRWGLAYVIVANTTIGKGVSFMEGDLKWHYKSMTQDEHIAALREVSK